MLRGGRVRVGEAAKDSYVGSKLWGSSERDMGEGSSLTWAEGGDEYADKRVGVGKID
jgi:hypothetical protein